MKQSILLPFIAVILLASCEHKAITVEEDKKFVLSDSMMHMIATDTVTECMITDELKLSGEVSFNENNVVKVFPRVSGQVVEARVSLGDRVAKGQTLAVIKSADIAANYNDLSSANADLAIAKRHMDNAESLYKSGINSEREFIEAKQNYEKALAARNKVQSVININGGGKASEGGKYVLTAPIDGYIVEKKVAAGAFIRPDMAEHLYTISDLKSVWVNADVYETDIPRIKEGDNVKVIPIAYPDKTLTGTISKVSQVLDPQSKTMRVRINLENKDMLLKPEMFTKVLVDNEGGSKVICVPTAAVLPRDNKSYVVVFKSKSDIKLAEIDIIKAVGDRAYVRSGINVGDVVISKHQLFVFTQLSEE